MSHDAPIMLDSGVGSKDYAISLDIPPIWSTPHDKSQVR